VFKHPRLLHYVEANPRIAHPRLLVMARWWRFQCGKPIVPVTPLGSFESGHVTLASILQTAGAPGFLGDLRDYLRRDGVFGAVSRDAEGLYDEFAGVDFTVSLGLQYQKKAGDRIGPEGIYITCAGQNMTLKSRRCRIRKSNLS
jgi:hypothetical protein